MPYTGFVHLNESFICFLNLFPYLCYTIVLYINHVKLVLRNYSPKELALPRVFLCHIGHVFVIFVSEIVL
jgi:hypothetical protein